MLPPPSTRVALALALATPLLLLGGAYLAQYGFGLVPCEMCWWQRYPLFAALAFALFALAAPAARASLVALAALAILGSGLVGAFHAGVEYGWWRGPARCTAALAGGDDPLAAILAAPVVRCDVAQWRLFGVSLAGWNFLVSTASALAIAWLLLGGARAREAAYGG